MANAFEVVSEFKTAADQAVLDAATAVTDIQDTRDGLWSGLAGEAGTGKTVTDVANAATAVKTDIVSTQSANDSLSAQIAQPAITPTWQSNALQDDVSFPVSNIDGTIPGQLGLLLLLPISVQQDRTWEVVRFGIATNAMTSFYVGIYQVDLSTGAATLVNNCGNVKSQLSTALNEQEITIPGGLTVHRGEAYYIGLLQVGGTASALFAWSNTAVFTTGQYPEAQASSLSGQSSLPSSVAAGSRSPAARVWGAAGLPGSNVATPPKAFYTDSFNRANAGSLGHQWINRKEG